MKRLFASVAVAAAIGLAIPTSAAAETHAKFDCKSAAAAWKKKHRSATPAEKQAEALALAQRGSCNIKTKDL